MFIVLGLSSFFSAFPINNKGFDWSITEEDLSKQFTVEKVSDGTSHGHGYSDFSEINPVVYVDNSTSEKKMEFYFYEKKLYKIYTIHKSKENESAFYKTKIIELQTVLGEPKEIYTDELFDMPIVHHIWETDTEKLDLRYGAGYVYEVRTNKSSADQKQLAIDRKHAI